MSSLHKRECGGAASLSLLTGGLWPVVAFIHMGADNDLGWEKVRAGWRGEKRGAYWAKVRA